MQRYALFGKKQKKCESIALFGDNRVFSAWKILIFGIIFVTLP